MHDRTDGPTALFVLGQSLVVRSYRSFFALLTQPSRVRVALAAPRRFRELGGQLVECEPFDRPFDSAGGDYPGFVLKSCNLHVQIVLFAGLFGALRRFFRPHGGKGPDGGQRQIFLCMAEPYSVTAFAAWLTARAALGANFVFICYTAQNIFKELAFPLRFIQKFIFRRSAAIVVVGREQESVLRRHGYRGICLDFPLWFDSLRFHPQARTQDKLVIGYGGTLSLEKGILDLLLGCEVQARRWGQSCRLMIAGAGPLAGQIRERCQRLAQLGWTVNFAGPLPAAQMPRLFSEIDILVVPSKTTPHWKEQFGRVIIEAKACGAIVVGSDSGEIPRVIGDPSRIFKEGDVESMTAVIDFWLEKLSDPERRAAARRAEAEAALAAFSDVALAAKFTKALARLDSSARSCG